VQEGGTYRHAPISRIAPQASWTYRGHRSKLHKQPAPRDLGCETHACMTQGTSRVCNDLAETSVNLFLDTLCSAYIQACQNCNLLVNKLHVINYASRLAYKGWLEHCLWSVPWGAVCHSEQVWSLLVAEAHRSSIQHSPTTTVGRDVCDLKRFLPLLVCLVLLCSPVVQ
jgi:hypothetical protein